MKLFALVLLGFILFPGCNNRRNENPDEAQNQGASIVVFIPGVMAGSAIYEMLAEGTIKAVEEFAASNQ